jgi:hypothetical protein
MHKNVLIGTLMKNNSCDMTAGKPSINNTIDTGSASQKRLKNIRAHFKGMVAYIDLNLNLK